MLTEDLGQVFYILVSIENNHIDSVYVKAITTPQAEKEMITYAHARSFSLFPETKEETDPSNPRVIMNWEVPQNNMVYTYVRREIDNIWAVDIIANRMNPYLLGD